MVGKLSNICFVLVIVSMSVFAQSEIDYDKFDGVKVKSHMNSRINSPYFKAYINYKLEENVKITALNSEKFKSSPEEILYKVYVSGSLKALRSNFYKQTQVDVKQYKQGLVVSQDTSKNFLLLRHKLTMLDGDREFVIIKYTQFVDSISVKDYTIQTLNNANKWLGVKLDKYSDAEFVMLNITAQEFWALNKGLQIDASEQLIPAQVLIQVKDNDGALNLSKLATYMRKRKAQGRVELLNNN